MLFSIVFSMYADLRILKVKPAGLCVFVLLSACCTYGLDCANESFFSGDQPVVIARAGGMGLLPENTLEAFEHCKQLGVDVIEIDLRMTKDNHLVVFQDQMLESTTNGRGDISEITLEKLKKLNAGYRFKNEDGELIYRENPLSVPTLEEVFAAFSDQKFLIEMKAGYETMPEKLRKVIKDFQMDQHVLIGSRDVAMLTRFREIAPEISTVAHEKEVKTFFVMSSTLLGGLYSPDCCVFQVPEYKGKTHVVTQKFIKAAHRKHIKVCVFLLDNEEDMERVLKLNIDGIVTNYPDRALKVLGRLSTD